VYAVRRGPKRRYAGHICKENFSRNCSSYHSAQNIYRWI